MYSNCVVNSNFKGEQPIDSNRLNKRQAKKAHFIKCFMDNTNIDVVSALDIDSHYLMSFLNPESINLSIVKPNQISIINANNPLFAAKDNIKSFINTYGNDFIIIDGIYKNKLATENWNKAIDNNDISISISFYHFGLISTNNDFTKQDFVLRF